MSHWKVVQAPCGCNQTCTSARLDPLDRVVVLLTRHCWSGFNLLAGSRAGRTWTFILSVMNHKKTQGRFLLLFKKKIQQNLACPSLLMSLHGFQLVPWPRADGTTLAVSLVWPPLVPCPPLCSRPDTRFCSLRILPSFLPLEAS